MNNLSTILSELIKTDPRISGNDTELARLTGIPQPTILRLKKGTSKNPRSETIMPLADFFGISISELRGEYLVTEKIAQPPSIDFVPVRYASIRLSAGVNGFEVDYHNEDMPPIFFRSDWLRSKRFKASKLIACQITGNSMEPRLHSGDSVAINTESNTPIDGKVFAVNYEGELVIKRLYRDNGSWYLRSDNPDKTRYSDKNCASDICIMIGEVVHRQSTEI